MPSTPISVGVVCAKEEIDQSAGNCPKGDADQRAPNGTDFGVNVPEYGSVDKECDELTNYQEYGGNSYRQSGQDFSAMFEVNNAWH